MAITSVDQWWRGAVIYQIYPKSWADGNGDGFGDIAGIRARLGYLSKLGVDALWLSPWYRSPQADGGYDVSDHRDIDPLFGTLGEASAFISEAHDLGLKVIVDIVPNHLSDQHQLFQAALASAPGSEQWQMFHCVAGSGPQGSEPPNDWQSAFGGPAWSPIRDADGEPTGYWYLHIFAPEQPDVNWNHPAIAAEYEATLRFWFDRGVDGFRIDVATGLAKESGYPSVAQWRAARPELGPYRTPYWDMPAVHEVWRAWRRISDSYTPPRAFVGEVWVDSPAAHAAYLRPDELHTAFNFDYILCPWDATRLREVVTATRAQARLVDAAMTWATDNHDLVRSRTRFGLEAAGCTTERHLRPDREPDDPVGLARARAALLFMLGLPGSAYLYQGQELALPEVLDLPDEVRADPAFARTNGEGGLRDGCRVPLPWDEQPPSFGFSASGRSWLPMPEGWGALSVAAQEEDQDSTLNLTRTALRLRRTEPALGDGDFTWVVDPDLVAPDPDDPNPGCLVLRRDVGPDDDSGALVVAVNMGTAPARVPGRSALLASGPLTQTPHGFLLPPDTAAWLRAPR